MANNSQNKNPDVPILDLEAGRIDVAIYKLMKGYNIVDQMKDEAVYGATSKSQIKEMIEYAAMTIFDQVSYALDEKGVGGFVEIIMVVGTDPEKEYEPKDEPITLDAAQIADMFNDMMEAGVFPGAKIRPRTGVSTADITQYLRGEKFARTKMRIKTAREKGGSGSRNFVPKHNKNEFRDKSPNRDITEEREGTDNNDPTEIS